MLEIIQVGNEAASNRYIRNKVRAIELAGMHAKHVQFPDGFSEEAILHEIKRANTDPNCSAIIVQLPLPKWIDKEKLLNAILPQKDIDGLSRSSPYFPLTPCAIMRHLRDMDTDFAGKHVTILGRSDLVGKPLAQLLMTAGATVSVCNSKTPEWLKENLCKSADIVVTATGNMDAFKPWYVSPYNQKQMFIDVGINEDSDGRMRGDIPASIRETIAQNGQYVSPVPGGVGKWTVEELVLRLKEMEGKTNSEVEKRHNS